MRWSGWAAGAGLAACVAAFAPAAGHAASEADFAARTAGDLATLCAPKSNSALDEAGVNFCAGFVQGAVLVQQEHQANPKTKRFFCLPDPAPSRSEGIAAFAAWVQGAPERAAMPAVDGLITFLGERYPCGKHR